MTILKQVLVVLAGLAIAVVMVLLGNWQLRAYHATGTETAAARAAEPPVELREVAPVGAAITEGFGRSVRAEGRYDPSLQLLVPTASPAGSFRVLSGLRQPDGSIVPVVRGIVTSPNAPPPPGEPVVEVGVLLPSEDNAPSMTTPGNQIDAVRLPVLAQRWPGPLVAGYLTLSAAESTEQQLTPVTLNLPEARGRLRNVAYAYQWYLFAAFTVAMAFRIARDLRRQSDLQSDALDDVLHSNAT